MAMPIIHFCVAKKILTAFDVNDKANFYLGTISPDSMHLLPYIETDKHEEHLKAHFTNRDFTIWENTAKDFIIEHKEDEYSDFYLGYGVHILTDIYFKEMVYSAFEQAYSEEGMTWDTRREVYNSDAALFEFDFFEKFDIKSDVWGYLEKSTAFDFGSLTEYEIKTWRDNTLRYFETNTKPTGQINYFTNGILTDFINRCSEKILNVLNEI
ncbi:MAG: hypothetical protein FWD34_08505 [Oscillospiraceae bacterium]|nr:hypothetical protein [Oscillospiraceae bacterium]